MKIKTAVKRIESEVNAGNFVVAAELLKKYQRKFGNRCFNYRLRLFIANGLWEMGLK
jgi:hypothetical protein